MLASPHIVEAELLSEHRLFEMVPIKPRQWQRMARQIADARGEDDLHVYPFRFCNGPDKCSGALRRRQQMCFGAHCGNQFDGASIETGEYRSAEPASFEGDHAIREISACFEDCEPSLDRWPVELHIGAVSKISDRCGDLADAAAIAAQQHPDKFTQHRKRHRDKFRAHQNVGCNPRLQRIVADGSTHQYVGIGGDSHRRPAHPCAAASEISSIERAFVPGRCSEPINFWIDPSGLAARNSARPSGSKSRTTLSPGATPRCRSSSLRNVTCPFAVMLRVAVILAPRKSG